MSDTTSQQCPDGYCIQMFDNSVWLTKELTVTPNYDERGIWTTESEAEIAMQNALKADQPTRTEDENE